LKKQGIGRKQPLVIKNAALTAPLNDQMDWLLAEGFSKTDCIFKYLNFAVFFAVKEGV